VNAQSRLSVLVLVAAVLVTAPVAAATNAAPKKPYNVAWFSTKSNAFLSAELAAVLKEAKKLKINITVFDSGFDANKQYSQIQDAITLNRFDGFIIVPLNGPALVPLIQQALKKKIKIVGSNTPLGPDPFNAGIQIKGVSGQISTSQVERGWWMAKQMAQACTGIDPCNVAYMAGVAALPLELGVRAGFEAMIKRYPNIHEVAYLDGTGFTTAGGQKVAADLLVAHPDINVIASEAQGALGAVLAVQAAGKSVGAGDNQIRVLGIGSACNVIAAIKSGQLYSTQPDAAFPQGKYSVDVMAAALGGVKRTQVIDPILAAKIPTVITKANASQYRCTY